MKNFVMTLVIFALFAVPMLAGAQELATPDDCSTPNVPYCDMAYFGGVNGDGETVLLRVHRMAGGFDSQAVASLKFAEIYIDALNETQPVFEPIADGSEEWVDHVGPNWAPTWETLRVVQGRSDFIEPNQDAFLFFIEANGKSYVFLVIGVHNTITEYLDDVLTTDNVRIIPEDYVQLDVSEDTDGGMFEDADKPGRI